MIQVLKLLLGAALWLAFMVIVLLFGDATLDRELL